MLNHNHSNSRRKYRVTQLLSIMVSKHYEYSVTSTTKSNFSRCAKAVSNDSQQLTLYYSFVTLRSLLFLRLLTPLHLPFTSTSIRTGRFIDDLVLSRRFTGHFRVLRPSLPRLLFRNSFSSFSLQPHYCVFSTETDKNGGRGAPGRKV